MRVGTLVLACAVVAALARPAAAHLMVAQHGTLHVVDDGGYLVLSVPVSAFAGDDDDGDGAWSPRELRAHAAAIEAEIRARVVLRDADDRALPLEGVMLSLVPPDDAPGAPSRQLVIMGRFALAGGHGALTLTMTLFGTGPDERSTSLTATRGHDKQLIVLTAEHPQQALFPPTWRNVVDAGAVGFRHVTSGLDHLLFLLVVVLAGWRVRQLVSVLSCFTLGHATTLIASTSLGLAIPAAIVEPAIAATIVGMALFDSTMATRERIGAGPAAGRLALVFACALIHGLGLAGGLAGLGFDAANRLDVLLGFNAGIELAQLVLALIAVGVLAAIRAGAGPSALRHATRLGWLAAMAVGSAWFVQRVLATL